MHAENNDFVAQVISLLAEATFKLMALIEYKVKEASAGKETSYGTLVNFALWVSKGFALILL